MDGVEEGGPADDAGRVAMALLVFAATLRIGMSTQRATTAVAVALALALVGAVRAADVARYWRVRNRMSRCCAG
ncbi:hypothetical protein [Teichococcus vastitatis]|uniref:hypothetical protein n=1 Tax=Teichococcus vastitatis TaxID=2307076 RepID=UPI000E725E91|nr:hypothetical protein [Pseudoroseomonas vastitatis]